jgi:hypothetical protein
MEMTAQARGWEQRILPAATEATNGAIERRMADK